MTCESCTRNAFGFCSTGDNSSTNSGQLIGSSDESKALGAQRRRADAAIVCGEDDRAGQSDAAAPTFLEKPERHIRQSAYDQEKGNQRHHRRPARLSNPMLVPRSTTARTNKMTSSPRRNTSVQTSCSVVRPMRW
jgi:hypothetical protein